MKYLKKFNESIDNLYKHMTKDLFTQIDRHEIDDLMKRVIKFENREEVDKIRGLFNKNYQITVDNFKFINAKRDNGRVRISIAKITDDYYLVKMGDVYSKGNIHFKCDEFLGLEDFIKSIIV